MGLEAIYPKPRLSQPAADHVIYPYLLRGVRVDRVNQVWSADITYVRLAAGFVYLVAVIDWFSRYVLSWAVSMTMDVAFCVEALDQALRQGQPEIFNTDQGAQFTSRAFTERLQTRRDPDQYGWPRAGPGQRVRGAVVAEVKYGGGVSARLSERAGRAPRVGTAILRFTTHERLHQALGYRTPAAVYHGEDSGLERARGKTFN